MNSDIVPSGGKSTPKPPIADPSFKPEFIADIPVKKPNHPLDSVSVKTTQATSASSSVAVGANAQNPSQISKNVNAGQSDKKTVTQGLKPKATAHQSQPLVVAAVAIVIAVALGITAFLAFRQGSL